ncbi:hypothetical protein VST7929_00780 [Vibrio stylophorae]|uniref:tRNA-uridine aminocarboxypropyltransferase n=1 Tax=Vibrio stylophorae TaxID=659351 RepID=A0ABN8DSI6_9VIBR|nr:hypothetical protein VST7929_00780 [Vibrio stylophorae]
MIILQHPSEGTKPLGSAVIASLTLNNCEIWQGENFSDDARFLKLLAEFQAAQCELALLFPSEQAQTLAQWQHGMDVSSLDQKTGTLARDKVLLVLDGTWKKAKKIWFLTPQLQALPQVCLTEPPQGEYLIRKSPRSDGLSTIEAIAYALQELGEKQAMCEQMLQVFRQMIAAQCAHMPADVLARYQSKG